MVSIRSGGIAVTVTASAALTVSAGVTPTVTAEVRAVSAAVRLLDTATDAGANTVALGMGGSGDPIPSAGLIEYVKTHFAEPDPLWFENQPTFEASTITPLFTPEGLYPLVGVKTLPFDTSVAQGVTILNSAIRGQLDAGHDVVVVGGSQSSTIASLEMRDLLALPQGEQPTADQLSFLLLVDPSAPNGGLLERFGDPSLPPLTIPSYGVTFSGATPADTPWDTAIYDMEYDGFSDFPRYPLNLLADINAALGIAFVHSQIEDLSDEQMHDMVKLPVSADYTGHTDYFIAPVQNLPLLDLVRDVPVLGNPIADLLQPDLKVLVNLGYGNVGYDVTDGWDHGPANVATPFELFPTDLDWAGVLPALADGAKQGVEDFIHDLQSLSVQNISEMTVGGLSTATDSLPSLTEIVNGLSAVASAASGALLPMADTVNALLTSLPAYDVALFVQELSAGNIVNAIGMPIAADFGVLPIALGFGALGIKDVVDAVQSLAAEF